MLLSLAGAIPVRRLYVSHVQVWLDDSRRKVTLLVLRLMILKHGKAAHSRICLELTLGTAPAVSGYEREKYACGRRPVIQDYAC